jgi:ribonuclease BN (tRNA processing enzyme)
MGFTATLLPLGTNAGVLTAPHQQPLSYLLELKVTSNTERKGNEKYQILLDVGSKYAADPRYVNPENLEAIFLSHAHLDHTRYLGSVVKLLKKHKRNRPLYVYCQAHAWNQLKWLIKLKCGSIPNFIQYEPTSLVMDDPFLKSHTKHTTTDFSQIKQLPDLELGNRFKISIVVAPAKHSKNSVAYRFKIAQIHDAKQSDDEQLDFIFCPDTSYSSEHLIPFAQDTTFWLLDAGFTKEEIDRRYEMFQKNEKGGEIVCHSSPYYSGKLCQAANVKNYVIIHYVWTRFANNYQEFPEKVSERARQTYAGNIIVSLDLKPISLR